MTPMVSVIIPTYNRASLVSAAIDSVLKQTFSDFELIVIDDGSTDDTGERVRPYSDRIRYFYQPNLGASAAQNAGIREATGKWVAILASDDIWHPTKLERQLEAISKLGQGFGACFTNCRYVGNPKMKSTAFEEAGIKPDQAFGPLHNPLRYIWEGVYGLYVQSLLVLRSLVVEVGGFDEDLKYNEDRDLIFRLSFKTQFCYVSAPLVDIDRRDAIPRLTSFAQEGDWQWFLYHEFSLRKMLEFPKLEDRGTRQMIQSELLAVYYNRAAGGIRDFNFRVTFDAVRRIHRVGQSFCKIWRTLFVRAVKKLLRGVQKRN